MDINNSTVSFSVNVVDLLDSLSTNEKYALMFLVTIIRNNKRIMEKIDKFKNEYFFLSNFYEVPVEYEGLKYGSGEAAFQAQKCEFPSKRKEFQNLNPSKSKALGRKVTLREDWDEVKEQIMLDIVRNKFKQNPDLGNKLVETGDTYLEEGNWWGDRIWGVCNGVGENRLGKILMKVRDELKNKQL